MGEYAPWYRIYLPPAHGEEPKGPLAKRDYWGISAQLGAGLLAQVVSRDATVAARNPTAQGAVRGSLGLWYRHWELEAFWRQQLFDFNGASNGFAPRWLGATGSVNIEGPHLFWNNVIPYVFLLLGYESYLNRVAAADTRFIEYYDAFTYGFRLRFVLWQTFETGGDVRYSNQSGISKFFVQGDIRYWLTEGWALGAGYWVDTAHRSDIDFRETHISLEVYSRFAF